MILKINIILRSPFNVLHSVGKRHIMWARRKRGEERKEVERKRIEER